MAKYRKRDFPVGEVRRFLEPGPIVLVSSAWRDRTNIMTLGWHMILEMEPSLVGCFIWSEDYSRHMIRKSKDCVINVPTEDMAAKVVDIGTWSTFPNKTLPNYSVDYAFGSLDTKLGGYLAVKSRVPAEEWISVGYPQNVDGGKTQQAVRGGKRTISSNILEMTENDMEGGSSGMFMASVTAYTAIGLNSDRSGAYMYSPYFDAGGLRRGCACERGCK